MIEKYSEEGDLILDVLDNANNFKNWLYEQIKPFIRGNILEFGSGHGSYSEKIIKDFPQSKICLSDIDNNYVNQLQNKFNKVNVTACKIDLCNQNDFKQINSLTQSAIAINVLEHVINDIDALNNVYDKLDSNGRFIILIPSHKFLYNRFDKNFGHYRRYSKKDILLKVNKTKFKVNKLFYFNFFSIFGWFFEGNILKKEIPNKKSIYLFDKLVPFFRFFEKYILRKKIGISLILVLEK
jgi:phospholipid N-methyltransferase